jgi:hypothetical protein
VAQKELMLLKWVIKRTHVFEMGNKKVRVFLKWVVKRKHFFLKMGSKKNACF